MTHRIPSIGIFLALLGLVACQRGTAVAKVGEPVSNGTNTVTVTEIQRGAFNIPGFNNYDILTVTVVSGDEPFGSEAVQKTSASLTDSEGNTFEANGAGMAEGDPMKAIFTFIVPRASKGFEFHYLDYPAVRLE